MSKFVRTVISDKDTIKTARLNLNTGEIKPFSYKGIAEEQTYIKMAQKLIKEEIEPSWMSIPAPQRSIIYSKPLHKASKHKENSNNVYLKDYSTMSESLEAIPILDNILTGAANLSGAANEKPINKGLLFNMLRDLDIISTESIQAYTGYSERYCRKLAVLLRVISVAFDNEIEK